MRELAYIIVFLYLVKAIYIIKDWFKPGLDWLITSLGLNQLELVLRL